MWDGMIESDSAAGAAFGVPQFSPMSVTPRRLIYRDAEALLRFVEPPMYPLSHRGCEVRTEPLLDPAGDQSMRAGAAVITDHRKI